MKIKTTLFNAAVPCQLRRMSRSHPAVGISAACTCGAVTIRVDGPIRSMLLCSCTECQKISGAGHAAVAIADTRSVTVSGNTRSFSRPADSGATLTRHFCPQCAVTLFAESSRFEGAVLLPAGLFGGSDWFRPSRVIFARSHLDWDTLPDNLPRHTTYRDG